MLKPQIPMFRVGWGGWQPIFDAESKFAKIPNSHVQGGWGKGAGGWRPTFDAESKFAIRSIREPQ